jgi:hypothetical protein
MQCYCIKIKDEKQPLLEIFPKDRDIRAGRTKSIYLIPELCVITGNYLIIKWILIEL